MARTNDARVKDVLTRDYDARRRPSLAPFIRAAAMLTDRLAAYDAANSEAPLSAADLIEIETWLAAHMYKQSDRANAATRTGDAQATFDGKTGEGLRSTLYGQTAVRLDASGYLAALEAGTGSGSAGRVVAGASWLGTRTDDQRPFWER